MGPIFRIFLIGCVLGAASIAWAALGGVMFARAGESRMRGGPEVGSLWGSEQAQDAPSLEVFRHDCSTQQAQSVVQIWCDTPAATPSIASTDIRADLASDARRRGLVWYPLYNVGFAGRWTYRHPDRAQDAGPTIPERLRITFRVPAQDAVYDAFKLEVDGVDRAAEIAPSEGNAQFEIPIVPGQVVNIAASYRSRGLRTWTYRPTTAAGVLEKFHLTMGTDFAAIDYPEGSMSPTRRERAGSGWTLHWDFERVLTGQTMGMIMPEHIQPGELAGKLAFSAPVSLLFFFIVLVVITLLRKIDVHPLNYLMLASSFFAFHLLFAYLVDHLDVVPAFALSSAVSVVLVVSYLRLVVSARFAFVEAAAAQLIYLIGFSLAHFWEGFTGLTITIMAILTLFVVMQVTGRLRWSEVLRRNSRAPPPPSPPAEYFSAG